MVPLLATHPVELGLKGREAAVLEQLRADPVDADLFPKSFPGENQPFTVENIARPLATFERTLISGRSPYDRYSRGSATVDATSAMQPKPQTGARRRSFFTTRDCTTYPKLRRCGISRLPGPICTMPASQRYRKS
jgi:cytochrome c peroxidase